MAAGKWKAAQLSFFARGLKVAFHTMVIELP
jgi:hypothetical protein